MQYKFIVTLDTSRHVEIEADIDNSVVEFKGKPFEVNAEPHVTEFSCDLCRDQQTNTSKCRAVSNIFELCTYFVHTKSIDQIDMTMIHNNKCISHSTRKAEDALVEMILVVIAASDCGNFGKLRWAWEFWNYESNLENLFYNLFSSLLVMECLKGDSKEPVVKTIEHVHLKVDKFHRFISSIIDHVKSDFTAKDAEGTSNALVSIWAIGSIFKDQTDELLADLKARIESTQRKTG